MPQMRQPIAAGSFYPDDRNSLEDQLKQLFSEVETEPEALGIVSPHAGYIYSGQTAAWAVSSLGEKNRFIILSPNHTGLGPRFSVFSEGSWHTPLGNCPIDEDLAGELLKQSFLEEDSLAHSQEHSIEVQLPFLQHRFNRFSFVPISIKNIGYSEEFLKQSQKLGETVSELAKKENIGLIASSDFSHYLPLETAKEKDDKALEKILSLDPEGFFQTLEEIDASVCGYGPIAILMSAARKLKLKPEVIHRSTSAEATGDESSVVSYIALGFKR